MCFHKVWELRTWIGGFVQISAVEYSSRTFDKSQRPEGTTSSARRGLLFFLACGAVPDFFPILFHPLFSAMFSVFSLAAELTKDRDAKEVC